MSHFFAFLLTALALIFSGVGLGLLPLQAVKRFLDLALYLLVIHLYLDSLLLGIGLILLITSIVYIHLILFDTLATALLPVLSLTLWVLLALLLASLTLFLALFFGLLSGVSSLIDGTKVDFSNDLRGVLQLGLSQTEYLGLLFSFRLGAGRCRILSVRRELVREWFGIFGIFCFFRFRFCFCLFLLCSFSLLPGFLLRFGFLEHFGLATSLCFGFGFGCGLGGGFALRLLTQDLLRLLASGLLGSGLSGCRSLSHAAGLLLGLLVRIQIDMPYHFGLRDLGCGTLRFLRLVD